MTKSHNEEGKEIKELARESQLVSGFGLQKQERLGGGTCLVWWICREDDWRLWGNLKLQEQVFQTRVWG